MDQGKYTFSTFLQSQCSLQQGQLWLPVGMQLRDRRIWLQPRIKSRGDLEALRKTVMARGYLIFQ